MKALVLASATTYQMFVKDNKLAPSDYRRIGSPDDLRGYRDTILIDVGDTWLTRDYYQIQEECSTGNIDIIYAVRG